MTRGDARHAVRSGWGGPAAGHSLGLRPARPLPVVTRLFDAPRGLVWRAWTEPRHIRRWWGPAHFSAPACQVDLRVGGAYLVCLRSPDGRNYWSAGIYREIVPLERLVYTDSFADQTGRVVPASHALISAGLPAGLPAGIRVTVTFEDAAGQTRLSLQHTGFPAAELAEPNAAGWIESFDRLAGCLQ